MNDRSPYPEPFRLNLPSPDRARLLARGLHITAVFGAGLLPIGPRLIARRQQAVETAEVFRVAFERLGATFLKLGQVVASAPGMFGEEVSAVFRSCLDTGPGVAYEKARATIENDLGRPLEEAFAHIDPVPVGRASLAVVHRATTVDGADVAIKILRPGIEDAVATDLALMAPLFKRLADQLGMEVAGAIDNLLDGLQEQLEEELDLRNELRTIDHHRELLSDAGTPLIAIPATYAELSGRRVLTMEFLDGVAIDDVVAVEAFGGDARPLARELVRYWFTSALRDGTFHADVHAGNLLAMRDGRLGLVDWGIVGRLDADTHLFFRQAVRAMLGDEDVWDELVAHLEKMYGPLLNEAMGGSSLDVRDMLRGVFEPFFTQPFSAFTMAELMQHMPQAQGLGAGRPKRSVRELQQSWRLNRRVRRLGQEKGVRELPFNRGMMMLVKQLLYFDRYGHLFLTDSALLDDSEYYASLLRRSA